MDLDCMKLIFKRKIQLGKLQPEKFQIIKTKSEDLIKKKEVTKEIKVVKLVTWGMSNTKIE